MVMMMVCVEIIKAVSQRYCQTVTTEMQKTDHRTPLGGSSRAPCYLTPHRPLHVELVVDLESRTSPALLFICLGCLLLR